MAGVLRLMENKTTLGFKKESNPYTAETLTSADYDYSVYNIAVSPDVATYLRKLSRGDLSQDIAITGKKSGTISWSIDVHSGDTVSTAPKYFEMLRCCGTKQETFGATGISITPHGDYDREPATIEVVFRQEGTSPKQLVLRFRGAMGNAKMVLDEIGMPKRIDFEFQGPWEAAETRAYASLITPTGFDTKLPPAVLAATLTLFGTEQFIGGMTIDFGNEIALFSDISQGSGYHGARITGRNPTVELDPDMLVTDDIDLFSKSSGNETGQLSITIGENLTFSAPAAQLEESPYNPSVREGHYANGIKLGLKRNTGNDEFELLQGSKS